MITVRLLASLRSAAKAKSVAVTLSPGASARDLLAALRREYPALADHIMDADGKLLPGMLLLVNGCHTDFLHGMNTPVSDTDDVWILPPVAGG